MMRIAKLAVAGATLAACAPASSQSDGLSQRLAVLARGGNAEAAYHLGMLYNNGVGVSQDNSRALEFFRAAAERGDPLAAYKVGCYYAGQFGVITPDEGEALRYKLIAAEAGYMLAQLDVAIIHYQRAAYAEAVRWFEAAVHQGDSQSLYNLSVMYREGQGISPSRARTYAFFRLAHLASRGSISPGAQQQLDELSRDMSNSERAEAEQIGTTWVTGPTELTQQARAGLERAELVARGAP
jgi:uncharacterized protein